MHMKELVWEKGPNFADPTNYLLVAIYKTEWPIYF